MSDFGQQLPEARLVPKGGADRMAVLRDQAKQGARAAGRVAILATKTIVVVALVGAGLVAIGAASRSRSDNDEASRRLERINQSLKSLQNMPRIDVNRLRELRLDARPRDPSAIVLDFETDDASPSQAATSSP